jgi:hypothetical protein
MARARVSKEKVPWLPWALAIRSSAYEVETIIALVILVRWVAGRRRTFSARLSFLFPHPFSHIPSFSFLTIGLACCTVLRLLEEIGARLLYIVPTYT